MIVFPLAGVNDDLSACIYFFGIGNAYLGRGIDFFIICQQILGLFLNKIQPLAAGCTANVIPLCVLTAVGKCLASGTYGFQADLAFFVARAGFHLDQARFVFLSFIDQTEAVGRDLEIFIVCLQVIVAVEPVVGVVPNPFEGPHRGFIRCIVGNVQLVSGVGRLRHHSQEFCFKASGIRHTILARSVVFSRHQCFCGISAGPGHESISLAVQPVSIRIGIGLFP